jgi:hypothetical protein
MFEMRNNLLVIFLSFSFLIGYAQPINQLTNKNQLTSIQFEVLPDNGYTIQQVSSDTSLRFNRMDTLHFNSSVSHYWIKFKLYNPSNFDKNYILYVNPAIESTSFQFDNVQQNWVSQKFGFYVAGRYFYRSRSSVITIRRNETQVNYTLCNVVEYKKYLKNFKPELFIILEKTQADKQSIPFYAWLISMVTLLLFFLYNAYLYFALKDKTYLYFLLLQIGAAIYITGSTRLFNYLIDIPYLSLSTFPNGEIRYFDKNSLANKIGSLLVIISFVQLTRHYLSTQIKIPKIDKRLKFILLFYVLVEVVTTSGFLTHQTLPNHHVDIENILLLGVLAYIYYVTWYSYRRSYKPAYYLLMANLIPFLL